MHHLRTRSLAYVYGHNDPSHPDKKVRNRERQICFEIAGTPNPDVTALHSPLLRSAARSLNPTRLLGTPPTPTFAITIIYHYQRSSLPSSASPLCWEKAEKKMEQQQLLEVITNVL